MADPEPVPEPLIMNESMRKLEENSDESKKIEEDVVFFDIEDDPPSTVDDPSFATRMRRLRTRLQR